jgi:hypothetical protein
MVVKINSFGLMGMDSYPVEVEGAINKGFPAFDMVGLPDAAVKESRDRVKSAMKNCGFPFPTATYPKKNISIAWSATACGQRWRPRACSPASS